MFEIFRRKPRQDLSIWPRTASKSLESLSLLFCSMGFPFSGWKHPDWKCSKENEALFKPACNAFQVATYFSFFVNKCDDDLLSGLARETFIEIAKLGRKDFAEALEYFLEVQDASMVVASENAEAGIDKYAAMLAVIAMGWLTLDAKSGKGDKVNLEDSSQEKRLNDLCKYLSHARTQALSAFEPMVNAIVDFDVENFKCFSFKKNRSVFEEVLWRRIEFPELFSHMPEVTATLLLDARRKERDSYYTLSGERKELLSVISERLKNNIMPDFAEPYFKSLSEIDDLSQKAFFIGGDCLPIYEELTKFRGNLVELSNQDENLERLVKACDNYKCLAFMSKIGGALRWVESSEVPSFILADTEEEIAAFAELVAADKTDWNQKIFTFLSDANILQNLTPAQIDFVNCRVKILSGEASD